jgi:S-layer homology domain
MYMKEIGRWFFVTAAGAAALWTGCGTSSPDATGTSEGTAALGVRSVSASTVAPGAQPATAAGVAASTAYGGGPVLSNVRLVAVFWGGNVNQTVVSGIPPFYLALASSAYLQGLDEYRTPTQTIGNGSFAGSFTIRPTDTNTVLSDDEVTTELAAQITAGALPRPDANTLYALHFPPGVTIDGPLNIGPSCQTFCAYHFAASKPVSGVPTTLQYTIMPDFGPGSGCDLGCGPESMFQNFTSTASHEVVEAVTDPQPFSGWSPEIGDFCNQQHANITVGGATYTVQQVFSNETSSCIVPTCATDICEGGSAACLPGSGCTLRNTGPVFADSSNPYEAASANHGWIGPCALSGGAEFYCPASSITRGELATVIIRALFGNTFSFTPTPYFTDVSPSDWRFPYIQKLRDLGITLGTSATTFTPDANATRGQAAVFVIRAYAFLNFGGIENFTACTNPYFTDEPSSDPFYRYIQELRSLGITLGTSATTYSPNLDINREAVAVFMMRAFDPAHAPDRIPVACP